MNAPDDLRTRFTRDARERLKTIRDAAADAAGDLGAEVLVNSSVEVVRAQAHMIKGAAGMLDFTQVKEAAAKLEDVAAETIDSGGDLAGDALSVALEQLGSAIEMLGP
jgi:HPt (histidine-containing phosphotransfer) domain-containing protein